MPKVMQWCSVDTFQTRKLAGLWSSGTAVTQDAKVADSQGGWMLAGHNHCRMNLALSQYMKQIATMFLRYHAALLTALVVTTWTNLELQRWLPLIN